MKVLKTIVATAVIVFAMTTVAMAGVQHLTRAQDVQAVDKTPAQYAVTLTDKQLAQLIDHQSGSHVREAQRTKTQARRVHREHAQAQQGAHKAEAQHVDRVQSSSQGSSSASQSSSHHYETSQQTHVSTGGHDGGHAGDHGGD
jgi:hypothetical protein